MIVECAAPAESLRLFRALSAARAEAALDVDALVHAERTVLVRGGAARDPRRLMRALDAALQRDSLAPEPDEPPSTIAIPVHYDGADLAEVAALTGMSAEQVVERHLAGDYSVAFIGFAPGFAYLTGGDPALEVPRRATPRPRVPAGAVGLAGAYSAVYPREGPGGWQIIGRTEHPMWDLTRDPPAALVLGDRVRFEAARQRVELDDRGSQSEPLEPLQSADPGAGPGLVIVDPGLQSLLQDRGRPGLSAMGVGAAGAADRGALQRANRLVGNRDDAVAVEIALGGLRARAERTLVLALSGAPRSGRIAGPRGSRAVPHGRAFRLDPGEVVELGAPDRGLRTVLALRGGIEHSRVLGSASRDTLSGIGPEPLVAGDVLRPGDAGRCAVRLPGPEPDRLPAAGETVEIEVVLGPRDDWFDAPGRAAFLQRLWSVTPRSDRVGVRLAGEPLIRDPAFEGHQLASEGLVAGSIQIPPDGQPVLFLADHPLTGGYPVIAVVSARHLDLAAQLPPGARVRFATQPDGGEPLGGVER